ncbi:hypothetical protein Q9966_006635 [Columba livia]|nr:hypothetical protein Q9966_006635 [Columba livia]
MRCSYRNSVYAAPSLPNATTCLSHSPQCLSISQLNLRTFLRCHVSAEVGMWLHSTVFLRRCQQQGLNLGLVMLKHTNNTSQTEGSRRWHWVVEKQERNHRLCSLTLEHLP